MLDFCRILATGFFLARSGGVLVVKCHKPDVVVYGDFFGGGSAFVILQVGGHKVVVIAVILIGCADDFVAIFDTIFKYPYVRFIVFANCGEQQIGGGYVADSCDFFAVSFFDRKCNFLHNNSPSFYVAFQRENQRAYFYAN